MLYSLYAKDLNSSFVYYRLLIGDKITQGFHFLTDIDFHLQSPKFMQMAMDQFNPQPLNQHFLKNFNYILLLTTDTPPTLEYLTLHHPELLL